MTFCVREKSGGDSNKSKSRQKVWRRKMKNNNNLYLLLSLFYFLHPPTRACHIRPRTRVRETWGAKSQKVGAGAGKDILTVSSKIASVGLRRDFPIKSAKGANKRGEAPGGAS
jgi:hypothetical protein